MWFNLKSFKRETQQCGWWKDEQMKSITSVVLYRCVCNGCITHGVWSEKKRRKCTAFAIYWQKYHTITQWALPWTITVQKKRVQRRSKVGFDKLPYVCEALSGYLLLFIYLFMFSVIAKYKMLASKWTENISIVHYVQKDFSIYWYLNILDSI